MKIEKKVLLHFPMWVRLWSLPEYCKTKELGEKIAGRVRKVLETTIFFPYKERKIRYMKVKVELDATQVIKSKLKIARLDMKTIEVAFKYERLGSFYNYSGHLRHESRACPRFLENSVNRKKKADKPGEWIKVNQVGRKLEEYNKNQDPNYQEAARRTAGGQKHLTPASLLCVFSNLSVSEVHGRKKKKTRRLPNESENGE